MTYPDQLIRLIDERADKRIAAFAKSGGSLTGATSGTVVHRDGPTTCQVTLDGSTLAVGVKVLGAVELLAGDRVGLLRIGTDWVVIDTFTRRRSLTLPDGAEPDDPAIVIGPEIPALIEDYYTFFTAEVHAVMVYRINQTEYSYDALYSFAGADVAIGRGTVIAGNVSEAFSVGATAGSAITYLNRFHGNHVAISNSTFPGGAFTIDGFSAPRGRRDFVSSTANTAAIGAEAVVLTGNSITWRAGRAYEVIHEADGVGSIANNAAAFQIRKTNLTGTILRTGMTFEMSSTAGVNETCHSRTIIRNNTGSHVVANIVLTLASLGGGTVTLAAAAAQVRYMEICDVGAASDYPSAVQI